MKLLIEKSIFLESLSLASHFTSGKTISSLVLQGILLRVEDESLHLYASNLSSFFHTVIKTGKKMAEKAEVVIEPRKIIEFISLLPEGKINVEIKEKQIMIWSGENKGVFPLMSQTDFPFPPVVRDKEEKIEVGELRKAIFFTYFCAATDEARPALTGIDIIPGDETLLVATDGFRLSLARIEKNLKIPKSIIPAEFLLEIFKHVKEEKETSFSYSLIEKVILFRIGQNEFYSRLIDGDAPPFEKVIPTERKTKITLNREDFLRKIKIVSVFARDLSNIVIVEITKEGVILKPKTDKTEEASSMLEAQIEGENQRIAFNYKFLLDFLNHVETKNIEVEILRSDAPVIFRPVGEKKLLHIIMPVRIQE